VFRTGTATAVAAVLVGVLASPAGAAPGNDADRIAAEIVAVQRQANQAAASISKLNQQYEAVSGEIADLAAQQTTLQGRLDSLTVTLRAVALERYVTAASDFTTVLGLSLGDPNGAAVGRYMTEFSTGGGNNQIDEYRTTAADMAVTSTALRSRQSQAVKQRDAVSRAQTGLETRLRDLQAAQVKARDDAAVQAALARQRAAEAARLQAAASPPPPPPASTSTTAPNPASAPQNQAAQAQPATTTPAPTTAPKRSFPVGAGFVCPVLGPTAFSDTYGDSHQGIRHLGVDMMGHLDQEIVAVVSGTVRHTQSGLGGNQIWLYGDDGNRYFYAHLNRYGDAGRVGAGQVIGYMGSTGETGAVHLHFEVHPGGGAAVNPTPIVAAYC
jgi:murein DD-endopeptidase MepM/ murein hydrolase activator NlpD